MSYQRKSQQLLKKTTCLFLLCVTTLMVLTYWMALPHTSNLRQYKTEENDAQINFGYKSNKRGSGTHLLKQQCRDVSQASKTDFSQVLRSLVVIDRYKVLYCRAGKTGSWTTLQLLYNLELETNMSRREVRKLAEEKPLPVLSDLSQEEIGRRLATYKKFLVARNPLERLASVWSGFFFTYPHFGWNERYQGMLRVLCPETSAKNEICHEATEIKGLRNKTHRLVPFRAFIKAIAENMTEFSNQHWRPIHEICSPCQIHYDFVAHTENLAEDLHAFFRKVGVTGRDHVFPPKRSRIGEQMFSDNFRKVPIEDILRIGVRYKDEYAFFGYSFEKDLQKLIEI